MKKRKLRIGYFADGPWSHLAFKKIIKNDAIEVCFIVPRCDTKDKTLSNFANEFDVDYIIPENINSKETLIKLKDYDCDLFVSMSYNQIFKQEIIEMPPKGIINCHAGKLPFYRGRNILNWALINDEKEFGITVHYVDEGIDTGDIILQRTYSINDDDNYNTLLTVAYEKCAEILHDTLNLFVNGNVSRVNQKTIHPYGMYCGKREEGDEIINWNQSSRDLFNFIRAISHPAPKATTYMNNNKVLINKSIYLPEAPIYKGKVGQVLSKTKNGFLVKTLDSYIEIQEVEGRIKVGETFNTK